MAAKAAPKIVDLRVLSRRNGPICPSQTAMGASPSRTALAVGNCENTLPSRMSAASSTIRTVVPPRASES